MSLQVFKLKTTKYMPLELGCVAETRLEYLKRVIIWKKRKKKRSVFLVSAFKSQFSLRQMKEECNESLPDHLIIVCKMTYEKDNCYSINWQNIVMNLQWENTVGE